MRTLLVSLNGWIALTLPQLVGFQEGFQGQIQQQRKKRKERKKRKRRKQKVRKERKEKKEGKKEYCKFSTIHADVFIFY